MMALRSMGQQRRGDQMAVGGGGGGDSSSSIALLQERFRQLQKMRERRQEMEVLKLLSKAESISQQTKYYEHSETIFRQPTTTRSSLQDSLSLGLDLYGKKPEHKPSNSKSTPPFRDFWSMNSATVSPSRTPDKPDVDTSLHL